MEGTELGKAEVLVGTRTHKGVIFCSSFSPQGHVELGIILNLWRYDLGLRLFPIQYALVD